MKLLAEELRRLYIDFFINRGHEEIASASLFPENDPSVLFTTAGMHPLVPFLLGERHPMGTRLVGVQKCVRTDDIDEVGDETHHTYFEMLGNWSLGDYFKKEAIEMSFCFLTEILHIPPQRLAVTVFGGDGQIPKDRESYGCWKELGLEPSRIYCYGRKENWWGPVGKTGPCGPDTEIFYDTGRPACGPQCGPACSCGKYTEIWNNVFLEYQMLPDGSLAALPQRNVDTGMGLERVLAVLNRQSSDYETGLFLPIMEELAQLAGAKKAGGTRDLRIIADHIRASSFILGDNRKISPSNTEQGYILRRLIRRTIRLLKRLGITENVLPQLAQTVIDLNCRAYPELQRNRQHIMAQLEQEHRRFSRTLDAGLKIAEKTLSALEPGDTLSGETAFRLFDTFGFPVEFTTELAGEKGVSVDLQGFYRQLELHKQKSRAGGRGVFQGGLAGQGEQTACLHTATHLLHGAIRAVLGEDALQRGSNITPQRLRFDFAFHRKPTPGELEQINSIVNGAIQKNLAVKCEEMPAEQAKSLGAVGLFEHKYGQTVKVYTIEGYSKEICGGPHAGNTGDLVSFSITKESSASAGVRRIKAVIGRQTAL